MSTELKAEKVNIFDLFTKYGKKFLIPNYQRPYAWGKEECETLWEDIYEFAIPEGSADKFNKKDEYYLGSIVTFKNDDEVNEVIDGQQRLTTLILLLRAFYDNFKDAKEEGMIAIRNSIENCIWGTTEFRTIDKDSIKINSDVATDADRLDFIDILKNGECDNVDSKSNYNENFKFFKEKIAKLSVRSLEATKFITPRILNNCVVISIESDTQDNALRIFSTLNNRGLPLADADIFKSQMYDFYKSKKEEKDFIERWKNLEDICRDTFKSKTFNPMDELFTRYMYYRRAKKGNTDSTTISLRKFYEEDKYCILKNDIILSELECLAEFWRDIFCQNEERFSTEILRKLFVLNYAPNGMWTYFVSVYFMSWKDENNKLYSEKFEKFLDKTIAFVWAYGIESPGVSSLRTPIYNEMVNIVKKKNITFEKYKFTRNVIETNLRNYRFLNSRNITKSMLVWWAFSNEKQEILDINAKYDIEHIYAKKRYELHGKLDDGNNLEALGNKSLLEKKINIRAADYNFIDKKKYYFNTKIQELSELSCKDDFEEKDIIERNNLIIERFINYLDENDLILSEKN